MSVMDENCKYDIDAYIETFKEYINEPDNDFSFFLSENGITVEMFLDEIRKVAEKNLIENGNTILTDVQFEECITRCHEETVTTILMRFHSLDLVETDGVNEEGELMYRITEKGKTLLNHYKETGEWHD